MTVDLRALAERFEAASQAYAAGKSVTRDDDWFFLKVQEESGEVVQAWLRRTGRKAGMAEPEALADELTDLLGHVLLIAHRFDLDLADAVRRKWRFDPKRG